MRKSPALCFVLCSLATMCASAQVNLNTPWLRGTIKGQQTTAAFMELEAHRTGDLALIGARSPVAKSIEIRELRRSKGVWKLHTTQKLEIPAGSSVLLKPGRSHLLLRGLQRQIRKGEAIPITLTFARGELPPFSIEVTAFAFPPNATSGIHAHHQH